MSGIFISYRREDSTAYARLLSEDLGDVFGPNLVFRDVDTMGPGVDFPTAIAEAVNECDVLLALIGERWLTAELGGRRRIDDENDYVRLEIQAALDRGILVVPVLLEDTRMPSRAELPGPLAKLADRNAHRLTDESWNYGVDRLATALRKVVAPPPPPPPPSPPPPAAAPPPAPPPAAPAPSARPVSGTPSSGAPSGGAPSPGAGRRTATILAVVGVVVVLAVIGLVAALAGGGGGDGGNTDDTTEVPTDSTEPTEEPPTDVAPALDLSPSAVSAGESVTLTGEGFQPGETVHVTANGEELGDTTADSDGQFSGTVPIAEDAVAGTYQVHAEGTDSGRSAVASVEVV
jgi:TIR domain